MSEASLWDMFRGTCPSERAALEDKQNGSEWNEVSGQLEPKDVNVAADEEEVGTQSICSLYLENIVSKPVRHVSKHVSYAQEKLSSTQTAVGAKLETPPDATVCSPQSAKMTTSKDSDTGNVDLSGGASTDPFHERVFKLIERSKMEPQEPNQLKTEDAHTRDSFEVPNQLEPEGSSAAVDGEDDVESFYSLYMEKDFRYYFQYPHARLFVAYFLTLCNFLIYAEDPVAHSYKEADIPFIGNAFAFIFKEYALSAWSLVRVITWIAGIVSGLLVGKFFLHQLFFSQYIFSILLGVLDSSNTFFATIIPSFPLAVLI